jgi:hypothetical protein
MSRASNTAVRQLRPVVQEHQGETTAPAPPAVEPSMSPEARTRFYAELEKFLDEHEGLMARLAK